jgi:hypothetical protein
MPYPMKDNLRNLKDGEAIDQLASHGCLRRIDAVTLHFCCRKDIWSTNAAVVIHYAFFVAPFISLGARPIWPGILASPDPQIPCCLPRLVRVLAVMAFFRARMANAWSSPA